MLNRTLILAAAAVIGIAAGAATGFLELIMLGVIAAILAIVLGLKSQHTDEAPGR